MHLLILVGADLIIQVGSDSVLLCSVITSLYLTDTFKCYSTIAYIYLTDSNYSFQTGSKHGYTDE